MMRFDECVEEFVVLLIAGSMDIDTLRALWALVGPT